MAGNGAKPPQVGPVHSCASHQSLNSGRREWSEGTSAASWTYCHTGKVHTLFGCVQNGASLPQQQAPAQHTQQPEQQQQQQQRPQDERQPEQQQQPEFPQQVTGAQISVRNIGKKFRTRRGIFTAVEDVTVEMEAGTITALVGPSGSGAPGVLAVGAALHAV